MNERIIPASKLPLVVAAIVLTACSRAALPPAPQPSQSAPVVAPAVKPAQTVNAADLEFMQGMIHHHAQAVLMAGWAPSHGANAAVQRLCERIINAQNDEIALIRRWLQDKQQEEMHHDMFMPGMLTDAQLKQLDQAHGTAFDTLFLKDMIQHHQGAITMVEKLRNAYGAAQDETVFRFSSDVYADQTTEIDRMQRMLEQMENAK